MLRLNAGMPPTPAGTIAKGVVATKALWRIWLANRNGSVLCLLTPESAGPIRKKSVSAKKSLAETAFCCIMTV
jgi:hypothetical protein